MGTIVAAGSFDDIQSKQIRFLEEAAKLGRVRVNLWSDEVVRQYSGSVPQLTEEERMYFVQAIRYVDQVTLVREAIQPDRLPLIPDAPIHGWAVMESDDTPQKRSFCADHGISYHVVQEATLKRFPPAPEMIQPSSQGRKKVVVTGCFDWLHSGHVRFFEETAALGDLTVVLGHDLNVRLLKGEGHPMFPENERRYMVQAVRYVQQALISSGSGWMDAEPEIALLKPDLYAVNEDGDKAEKKAFCEAHGIEYVVLKRLPKEGLPKRESTVLRGF